MRKQTIIEDSTKIAKLTIVSFFGVVKGHRMYNCLCECGKTKIIRGSALLTKNTLSCGCLNDKLASELSRKYCQTHGDTIGGKSIEYEAYIHMKARCYTKSNARYKNYGGRGIRVCNRWLGEHGFKFFLSDMGRRPDSNHSLERKKVNKNYTPSNCIWATSSVQAANKTTTVRLIVNGEKMYQSKLAKILCVSDGAIAYRIKKGESGNKIFRHFKNKQHVA